MALQALVVGCLHVDGHLRIQIAVHDQLMLCLARDSIAAFEDLESRLALFPLMAVWIEIVEAGGQFREGIGQEMSQPVTSHALPHAVMRTGFNDLGRADCRGNWDLRASPRSHDGKRKNKPISGFHIFFHDRLEGRLQNPSLANNSALADLDRKSTRLNSSHGYIS